MLPRAERRRPVDHDVVVLLIQQRPRVHRSSARARRVQQGRLQRRQRAGAATRPPACAQRCSRCRGTYTYSPRSCIKTSTSRARTWCASRATSKRSVTLKVAQSWVQGATAAQRAPHPARWMRRRQRAQTGSPCCWRCHAARQTLHQTPRQTLQGPARPLLQACASHGRPPQRRSSRRPGARPAARHAAAHCPARGSGHRQAAASGWGHALLGARPARVPARPGRRWRPPACGCAPLNIGATSECIWQPDSRQRLHE